MSLIVDEARRRIVSDILATKTAALCWPTWQQEIRSILGPTPTDESVLNLGANLSKVFASTSPPSGEGPAGRSQSSVSGGGSAWESLVAWYLNLVLVGTSSLVIKKKTQVPMTIRHALTVRYGSVQANTESDLVAIGFPEDEALSEPLERKESAFDRLEQVASRRFKELSVAVVQCKTNWNDNSQIPMAWDMIYQAREFMKNRVQVGQNGRHLNGLASFRYAFVTVPSNKRGSFEGSSLHVQRVSQLSGGTYWGQPTKNGVAESLDNIFPRIAIGPMGGTGYRETLQASIKTLSSKYDYFKI